MDGTLQVVAQIAQALVWLRHLGGATQTFKVARGERPLLRLQLFTLAIAALVYSSFRAPFRIEFAVPGLVLLAGSLVLFEWARRSIRGRFFSYVYSPDIPEFIFTGGPFAHVRNPFYSSYMLSYLASALMFPSVAALLVLVGMGWFFARAARFEEAKFAASPLAQQYAAYQSRTGRFLPRLRL